MNSILSSCSPLAVRKPGLGTKLWKRRQTFSNEFGPIAQLIALAEGRGLGDEEAAAGCSRDGEGNGTKNGDEGADVGVKARARA